MFNLLLCLSLSLSLIVGATVAIIKPLWQQLASNYAQYLTSTAQLRCFLLTCFQFGRSVIKVVGTSGQPGKQELILRPDNAIVRSPRNENSI